MKSAPSCGIVRCLAVARTAIPFVAIAFWLCVPSAWPQATSTSATGSSVTVVLPPRIVAGRPATLAVIGADGKLAPGAQVNLGPDTTVTTDQTGRASFTAPESGGVLIAKASGAAVAALVDPPQASTNPPAISVPPVVSLRDRFPICGGDFRGDADANRVKINGQPSLVLAASPECLVALPGPQAAPGSATISIESPGGQWTAKSALVSLVFESPRPPLQPNKRSQIFVRVQGSEQKLRLVVENETPGAIRFLGGDSQQVVTSGGAQNSVALKVQAIRSGDFSFHARLLPAADADAARRYLGAAIALAPRDLRRKIIHLADGLSGSAHDSEKVRLALDKIAAHAAQGDFLTLLNAARAAL